MQDAGEILAAETDRAPEDTGVGPVADVSNSSELFYISSFGASATVWIGRALSLHPDVVCWHGTRAVPPHVAGTGDLSPEDFADELLICARNTGGAKAFGAIHGFHGTRAKAAFEARGGRFSCVLRDPVKRIHSLFWAYAEDVLGQPVDDVYGVVGALATEQRLRPLRGRERLANRLGRLAGRHEAEQRLREYKSATGLVSKFRWICNRTLEYDLECIASLESEQVARMESLTTDPDALDRFLDRNVRSGIGCTDAMRQRLFSGQKLNRHARRPLESTEILESWPPALREIYRAALERLGLDRLQEAYGAFGYALPR